MAEKSVFERIKKQNGERFAKAIRSYDNGIFDIPGIVDIVKYAGREAEPIMNYLESLKTIEIEVQGVHKDPITLLSEAGYDAYYADTLKKQNAPKKYFAPGEELCTFRDPERFKNFHMIWCIRKDVDKIKREDFKGKEEREDEYGTSVMCIQVLKTGGFISIKNRYNHTVENPDNTLNSNPDNIIKGLSSSIQHHYQVDFSSHKTNLPDNFIIVGNKPVKIRNEFDGIYFGEDFYVDRGVIHPIDKDKEILMDNYIFNLKEKSVRVTTGYRDEFTDIFNRELEDKKVKITKDEKGQHIIVIDPKDKKKTFEIATIQNGQITGLYLPTTKNLGYGSCFLPYNRALSHLYLPVCEHMENALPCNQDLSVLYAPQLKIMIKSLKNNTQLTKLELPQLTYMDCFIGNTGLTSVNAPNFIDDHHPIYGRCLDLLSWNEKCKTNSPALLKKCSSPEKRTLGKGLLNRLMGAQNSPEPLREMLETSSNHPDPLRCPQQGFWGRLWQRIKPHD